MSIVSSELAGILVPDKRNWFTLSMPTLICFTICVTSWPPTKQSFYQAVFSCMMVCVGTLMSAVLWRLKESITSIAISFSVLLTAIGLSALAKGKLWDGAWFTGFFMIALAFKSAPAADYNSD
jgi:uncharacterized membrane protein